MIKNIEEIIANLKSREINGWFDLGRFLDELRENSQPPTQENSYEDIEAFLKQIKRGIAFVTFSLGIDGLSVEMIKYAEALRKILNDIDGRRTKIHWIAGSFDDRAHYFRAKNTPTFQIEGMEGFDKWGEPYFTLFHKMLRRGEVEYNRMPLLIWQQSLRFFQKLAQYISDNNIGLIISVNTNSNPGNLSLALALSLVSEQLKIPVINTNHDFYWEGGKPRRQHKEGEQAGPRDHFFTNAHLTEFFSILYMLYPWESRRWLQVNINTQQSFKLAFEHGISPANIANITTAVDTEYYRIHTQAEKKAIKKKLSCILAGDASGLGYTLDPDYLNLFSSEPAVLGREAGIPFTFDDNTILLLQPTRIIRQKKIEKDVLLIEELLNHEGIIKLLEENPQKKIVLLVTGPIAFGHEEYLQEIQNSIIEFYTTDPHLSERVFFAFTFGNKIEAFPLGDSEHVLVSELYAIADLVLLPSQAEGRGLPIIESSAAGVPIACSRYEPEEIFKMIVGEDLPEEERISFLEFPKEEITEDFVNEVYEVLVDRKRRRAISSQNAQAVSKRFSNRALIENFKLILEKLWRQVRYQPEEEQIADTVLTNVRKRPETDIANIVGVGNREYLPGYYRLAFLFTLRALIDPTYFRIEERELKSRIYRFASHLFSSSEIPPSMEHLFYRIVDRLFSRYEGYREILHDFTFDFRKGTKKRYLYRELTEQELFGRIVAAAREVFREANPKTVFLGGNSVKAANLRAITELRHLSNKRWLELLMELPLAARYEPTGVGLDMRFADDSDTELGERLQSTASIGLIVDNREWFFEEVVSKPSKLIHFCNSGGETVFDMKILGERLLLHWERTAHKNKDSDGFSVTFAARGERFANDVTIGDILDLLAMPEFSELRRLYKEGKFFVLPTGSKSKGVNLLEGRDELLSAIQNAKAAGGVATIRGIDNYFTLELIDLPTYRFGCVNDKLAANLTGFDYGSLYFQFVPQGLRPTIAYPVPQQRAIDLSTNLSSEEYISAFNLLANNAEKGYSELAHLSDQMGLTFKESLKRVSSIEVHKKRPRKSSGSPLQIEKIAGRHKDGAPWMGAYAKLVTNGNSRSEKGRGRYSVQIITSEHPEPIPVLARSYKNASGHEVRLAWNGGYLLSPELVGRLGISEDYIGTPLGLIVKSGEIKSLPLFSRPIFGAGKNGKMIITYITLNCEGAICCPENHEAPLIKWKKNSLNPEPDKLESLPVAVYNLMYPHDYLPVSGRVLLRITGDKIAKIHTELSREVKDGVVPMLPVGAVISVNAKLFNSKYHQFFREGLKIGFKLKTDELNGIQSAIEAGPLLIKDGKIALDLASEGWLTPKSIRTQMLRLESDNLRSPKIGVGIAGTGELLVCAVNGRLRDSLGVTFGELADIMLSLGAENALCFSPGSHVTLYANGSVHNIPPYNEDYESFPYTLPPRARAVLNAIFLVDEKSKIKRT